LVIAFKIGTIGGGGSGADRNERPMLFWLGISITAVMCVFGIGIFISTLV
jgi:hypothetical protein